MINPNWSLGPYSAMWMSPHPFYDLAWGPESVVQKMTSAYVVHAAGEKVMMPSDFTAGFLLATTEQGRPF